MAKTDKREKGAKSPLSPYKWEIGKEYCAYELSGTNINGIKFIFVADIEKNTIYGKLREGYRYFTIKFSTRTGKEFRANQRRWFWLTLRKVKRNE